MTNFNVPIRSLAILFLFGAVFVFLEFPTNPITPHLSRALWWWFLAFGVVRWVENGLIKVFEDSEGDVDMVALKFVEVPAFLAHLFFLVLGVSEFVAVLHTLP